MSDSTCRICGIVLIVPDGKAGRRPTVCPSSYVKKGRGRSRVLSACEREANKASTLARLARSVDAQALPAEKRVAVAKDMNAARMRLVRATGS